MATGPAEVAEPRGLSRSRFNLLTSSVLEPSTDEHWLNGFKVRPEPCDQSDNPIVWACQTNEPVAKTIPTEPATLSVPAFMAWAGTKCSTLSNHNFADFRARATRALERCLPKVLEGEAWTGDAADAAGVASLRFSATGGGSTLSTLQNGARYPHISALAELEQAGADCQCGGPHVIHAQPRVVTVWSRYGLVKPVPANDSLSWASIGIPGPTLQTAQGNIVVPGAGYDGSGTSVTGGDSQNSWAYLTPPLHVKLGQMFVDPEDFQQVNRSLNDVELRAEQGFAYWWEGCCHVGVQVDLCDAICTEVS